MAQILNKEKLVSAVKNIPIAAEKEGWVLSLDKDEGALFYAPKVIPDDSTLHQVTDEYALYVDKDFNPKGVVVEYYQGNFLEHHTAFKEITSKIFGDLRENKDAIVTVDSQSSNKDAAIFKALLESTLIKETGTNLLPA